MLTDNELIEFKRRGYLLIDNFLSSAELTEIELKINSIYLGGDILVVNKKNLLRTQKFYTLLGSEVLKKIPIINQIFEHRVKDLLDGLFGPKFVPLENKDIGVSLNITPQSGSLSFHYDRNEITAILYIQDCEDGGELELFPRFRILLPYRYNSVIKFFQRIFDVLLRTPLLLKFRSQQRFIITPRKNCLLIMQGSRCLHRVLPVFGDRSRIAFVFCYDKPLVVWSRHNAKDYYGYNAQKLNGK